MPALRGQLPEDGGMNRSGVDEPTNAGAGRDGFR